MARVLIEGFEGGDLGMWAVNGYAVVVASTGLDMDGDYCMRTGTINANSGCLFKSFSPTLTELWMTIWVRPTYTALVGNPAPFITFYDVGGATILGSVLWNGTTNHFVALKGPNTILGTGTATISLNTTYKVEVHYKPHASDGIFEIKVNGTSDVNSTGVATAPSTTNIGQIQIGTSPVAGGVNQYALDNVIIDDATYPGILTRIVGIVPNANGGTVEWTPSTGNNYACVDERPASSSDYVSVNTADQTDLYNHAGAPGAVYNVHALQVQAKAVKEGAAAPANLKLAIKPSDTIRLSDSKAVPLVAADVVNLWLTNPDTGLAFTPEELNAMSFGIKSIT